MEMEIVLLARTFLYRDVICWFSLFHPMSIHLIYFFIQFNRMTSPLKMQSEML